MLVTLTMPVPLGVSLVGGSSSGDKGHICRCDPCHATKISLLFFIAPGEGLLYHLPLLRDRRRGCAAEDVITSPQSYPQPIGLHLNKLRRLFLLVDIIFAD